MIELFLPFPPSANRLWSRTKTGARLSDGYSKWLRDAALLANAQRQGRRIDGPYHLSVGAVRPDRRRRDLDNLLKGVSDLLVKIGAVTDDSYCEMISARWLTVGEGVEVRVSPAAVEA